jgi:hypothetical protein
MDAINKEEAKAKELRPDWTAITKSLEALCHWSEVDARPFIRPAVEMGRRITNELRGMPLQERHCCVLREISVANHCIRFEWSGPKCQVFVVAFDGEFNQAVFTPDGEPVEEHESCSPEEIIHSFRYFIRRPGAGISSYLELSELKDF